MQNPADNQGLVGVQQSDVQEETRDLWESDMMYSEIWQDPRPKQSWTRRPPPDCAAISSTYIYAYLFSHTWFHFSVSLPGPGLYPVQKKWRGLTDRRSSQPWRAAADRAPQQRRGRPPAGPWFSWKKSPWPSSSRKERRPQATTRRERGACEASAWER